VIDYVAPRESDIPVYARLHVTCWQQAYAGLMDADFLEKLSVAAREEGWRKTLSDPDVFCRLAVDGGVPVGFVSCGPSRLPQYADGEVYALYVLQSHQGKGIGRTLFQSALHSWKNRNGRSVVVCVISNNANAIAFYRRMSVRKIDEGDFELGGMRLKEDVMVLDVATGKV
jgi:ribosomal protein S18 acetylase RimI-like enzyme